MARAAPPKQYGCGMLIAIIAAVLFIGSLFSSDPPRTPSQPRAGSVGTQVELRIASGSIVVSVSEQAYDEFQTLAIAEDLIGIAQLVADGVAFTVPSGTAALVIDRGFEKRRVRILEGEHAGRTGWVTSTLAQ
jgi:hypothetical protein